MLGSAVGHCTGSSSSCGSIGSSIGSKVRQFMDVDSSPWGASVGLILLLPSTLSSCTSSRNSTNYVLFASSCRQSRNLHHIHLVTHSNKNIITFKHSNHNIAMQIKMPTQAYKLYHDLSEPCELKESQWHQRHDACGEKNK